MLWTGYQLLLKKYYCSITFVPIFPPLLSPALPTSLSHIQSMPLPPRYPCPWILYTYMFLDLALPVIFISKLLEPTRVWCFKTKCGCKNGLKIKLLIYFKGLSIMRVLPWSWAWEQRRSLVGCFCLSDSFLSGPFSKHSSSKSLLCWLQATQKRALIFSPKRVSFVSVL